MADGNDAISDELSALSAPLENKRLHASAWGVLVKVHIVLYHWILPLNWIE